MQTTAELIALLPSAEEMVKDVIERLRKPKPAKIYRTHRTPDPLWSRVGKQFGHGSGYSWAICVKYGFDGDETWIGMSAK